jgi:acyl carrier protein
VPLATTDLLDTGILDSQKFVELLIHLEQKFDAQIDLQDFEMENFRCIERIANLVLQRKTSAKAATS